MNIIIRSHARDMERIKLLDRTLNSLFTQEMNTLGNVFIVDNNSPLHEEVRAVVRSYSIGGVFTKSDPDTKGGLYQSMLLNGDDPSLHCVDDFVFGKGSKSVFLNLLFHDIPEIEKQGIKWGAVGTFACYLKEFREPHLIPGTLLWDFPLRAFYSLLCHVYNPIFCKMIIEDWENIMVGKKPYPTMCDDIWVSTLCQETGYHILNTYHDYAQHTGMKNRSFGEKSDDNSQYQTPCFVGE